MQTRRAALLGVGALALAAAMPALAKKGKKPPKPKAPKPKSLTNADSVADLDPRGMPRPDNPSFG